MKKFMLGLRVFLEGMFLGAGGCFLFGALEILLQPLLEDPLKNMFGVGPGMDDALHAVSVLLLAVPAIWILKARRKDLGDRIGTAAYILLTLAAFALIGVWCFLYLAGMD